MTGQRTRNFGRDSIQAMTQFRGDWQSEIRQNAKTRRHEGLEGGLSDLLGDPQHS